MSKVRLQYKGKYSSPSISNELQIYRRECPRIHIDYSSFVDEDCSQKQLPNFSPVRTTSYSRERSSTCPAYNGRKDSIISGADRTTRKDSIITPTSKAEKVEVADPWQYCRTPKNPHNIEFDKNLRLFGTKAQAQKLDIYLQKARELEIKYISPNPKARKSWLESINEEESSEEQLSDEGQSAYTVQPQNYNAKRLSPALDNSRISIDRQTTKIIHPKQAGNALIERLSRAYRK